MNEWIIAAAAAAFTLLCPIFFTIYLFTDLHEKKCCFAFYVLRFIKLHGGYAQPYHGGIAFHLTDKKAFLLPFGEMISANKRFRILRGFRLLAYSHVVEIGSAADPGKALILATLAQGGSAAAGAAVKACRKCRSFKSDVLLHQGHDVAKISQRTILVFNLLLLLCAAWKLFLRKILEWSAEHEKNRKKTESK